MSVATSDMDSSSSKGLLVVSLTSNEDFSVAGSLINGDIKDPEGKARRIGDVKGGGDCTGECTEEVASLCTGMTFGTGFE